MRMRVAVLGVVLLVLLSLLALALAWRVWDAGHNNPSPPPANAMLVQRVAPHTAPLGRKP